MDQLSKHQLILVALLVSFVTSLSTGIITVSLMDQAPKGTTQTITQVIQKTIQQAMPQDAAATEAAPVTIEYKDPVADAVSKVASSTVKLVSSGSNTVSGLGLVVSNSGIIFADKAAIAQLANYEAILPDGTRVPLALIQSQIDGNIAFLAPAQKVAPGTAFVPASFAPEPHLGETVFTLSGTSTPLLAQGIVTRLPQGVPTSDISSAPHIETNISADSVSEGAPLFDVNGAIIGIRSTDISTNNTAKFYPISALKQVIPTVR